MFLILCKEKAPILGAFFDLYHLYFDLKLLDRPINFL